VRVPRTVLSTHEIKTVRDTRTLCGTEYDRLSFRRLGA